MALGFNSTKGTAQKSGVKQYTMKNGDNKVRLVGGILPRYVYWLQGENNKNIPFECLAFDRNNEAFLNKEKDWVREYYPDLKCTWAYSIQAFDASEGGEPELVVFNLKKKLLESIKTAAEDLGDPTDPETGWDICFKKVKTGPLAYNVEYQLQVLKCKNRPLSVNEKALIANSASIDEVLVRPTPESQKDLLDKINNFNTDKMSAETESEFDIK